MIFEIIAEIFLGLLIVTHSAVFYHMEKKPQYLIIAKRVTKITTPFLLFYFFGKTKGLSKKVHDSVKELEKLSTTTKKDIKELKRVTSGIPNLPPQKKKKPEAESLHKQIYGHESKSTYEKKNLLEIPNINNDVESGKGGRD